MSDGKTPSVRLCLTFEEVSEQLADANTSIGALEVKNRELEAELARMQGELRDALAQLSVSRAALTTANAKYDCVRDMLRDLFDRAVARTLIAR
jgi:chromosome segregation ATPase